MTIEQLLPEVQKNILLKNYTTFKIGGSAKYFFVAKNKKDLILAIDVAKKLNLPFFILGGGSNLLVSDKGYKGLVVKIENCELQIKNCRVTAGAGVPLSLLVNKTTEKNLTGLEWAMGIPGTVGGAIFGNAGAFGKSMKDVIESVEVLDIGKINPPKFCEAKIRRVKNKDCKFHYRDSIFKHKRNLVILSATLQLKKGRKEEIKKKINECLNYRKETQPLNFPSVGSIFKNPPGFSAGELITKCDLKGKRIGNVKISEKHANFIVHLGNGKAKDVIELIKLAKRKVKNKFGIFLEEEIQYLGFSTLDRVV